jgi:hypothetical protein
MPFVCLLPWPGCISNYTSLLSSSLSSKAASLTWLIVPSGFSSTLGVLLEVEVTLLLGSDRILGCSYWFFIVESLEELGIRLLSWFCA